MGELLDAARNARRDLEHGARLLAGKGVTKASRKRCTKVFVEYAFKLADHLEAVAEKAEVLAEENEELRANRTLTSDSDAEQEPLI